MGEGLPLRERLARGVVIGNEKSHLNEIGFENAVAKDVPTFALFRESGKKVAGKGPVYRVRSFNYGLILPGLGAPGVLGQRYDAAALANLPEPLPPAIPPLPPTTEWTNVRTLGVTGDGKTDDTAAIRKAIDEHRVLYFPSGQYLVKDTIDTQARHGADRPASAYDAHRSAGRHGGFPGRGRAARRDTGAAGRREPDERTGRLHRRDQSARGGRAVVGGRGVADGRRAAARRTRERIDRIPTTPTTPPIPIRASAGTDSIRASG